MTFGMVMNILIIACGVYMIYWSIQMKQTHKIPEMLVGKGFPISRAKNPEGFINATFPFTIGTGIMLFVAGMFGALEIFAAYPLIDTLISVVIVVIIIIYGSFLMKAQKKYLVGLEDTKNKKR